MAVELCKQGERDAEEDRGRDAGRQPEYPTETPEDEGGSEKKNDCPRRVEAGTEGHGAFQEFTRREQKRSGGLGAHGAHACCFQVKEHGRLRRAEDGKGQKRD